jgi:hypothetical protein
MDRIQTVNGGQDTLHPRGTPDFRPPSGGPEEAEYQETPAPQAANRAAAAPFGACLYLGPRGQRCDKAATVSGFCEKHAAAGRVGAVSGAGGRAAEPNPAKDRTRAFAAILGLLGVLWPIISEVARAIISFLHQK